MGKLRFYIALWAGKLCRPVLKLTRHKATTFPGELALRLCPSFLQYVHMPEQVIAVTGSNGKTSSVEMIAAMLAADGRQVVYNKEGSNQIEGVTALLLYNCSLTGRVRGDVLLLESDERYAKFTFRWFHPTHYVITNLYRDQLTRNGHQQWVYDAILPSIHPETTLILNGDDPLVASFAQGHDPEKVKWFGLEENPSSTKEHQGIYDDGARCPLCQGRMEYSCYHFAHIGHYRCTVCGYSRPAPDFAGTALDLEQGQLTINGQTQIHLAFRSIYNIYNILAAWSVCSLAGVSPQTMAQVLNNYMLKNGRIVRFTLGAHRGALLISKHENSVAYDTNLGYIQSLDEPCEVMIIVDAVSRRYFTGETSWLWDIDFDRLNAPHVRRIWLCGTYENDLALRFDYTQVSPDKLQFRQSIPQAVEELKAGGDLPLYVMTCFSDRDKLLNLVQLEQGGD